MSSPPQHNHLSANYDPSAAATPGSPIGRPLTPGSTNAQQPAPASAPPPGQYAPYPPPGQYPYPPGPYPPPPGPPGQYVPYGSPGQPPYPPYGYPQYYPQYQYQPYGQAMPQPGAGGAPPNAPAAQGAPSAPAATPAFPSSDPNVQAPFQPAYYPPPPMPHAEPLWYLGTSIVDPHAPPAAHGVVKVQGYDPAVDFERIQKATATGRGDETKLTAVILPLNVFQMDALRDFCVAKLGKSLPDKLERCTSGNYALALRGLTLGPLGYDVELANKAIVGFGTNETLLIELILGRPAHEIRLLIAAYRLRYGRDLIEAVKSDLSGKTERMFTMALNAQRPPDTLPIDPKQIEADVEALHHAAKKREEIPFCEVLINRSQPHLAAVISSFGYKYKSLSKVIKKSFSGVTEESFLYIMHGAKPKRDGQGVWRDAKMLEKSMAGLGTRDQQLIYRLIRAHWNPQRLEAIKDAYKRRYGKTLEHRVKGDTSGSYRDLLLAIVRSSDIKK